MASFWLVKRLETFIVLKLKHDFMQDYLKVGVSGFDVGSNIIDKKMLEENDWDGITNLAKKYVSLLA